MHILMNFGSLFCRCSRRQSFCAKLKLCRCENFSTCEISQVANFCNLRNFQGCEFSKPAKFRTVAKSHLRAPSSSPGMAKTRGGHSHRPRVRTSSPPPTDGSNLGPHPTAVAVAPLAIIAPAVAVPLRLLPSSPRPPLRLLQSPP